MAVRSLLVVAAGVLLLGVVSACAGDDGNLTGDGSPSPGPTWTTPLYTLPPGEEFDPEGYDPEGDRSAAAESATPRG
jgi:hypothetical protein